MEPLSPSEVKEINVALRDFGEQTSSSLFAKTFNRVLSALKDRDLTDFRMGKPAIWSFDLGSKDKKRHNFTITVHSNALSGYNGNMSLVCLSDDKERAIALEWESGIKNSIRDGLSGIIGIDDPQEVLNLFASINDIVGAEDENFYAPDVIEGVETVRIESVKDERLKFLRTFFPNIYDADELYFMP